MTSVDAVQVIIAQLDQKHGSNLERYEGILAQLGRGGPVDDNEVNASARPPCRNSNKDLTDLKHDPTDRNPQQLQSKRTQRAG